MKTKLIDRTSCAMRILCTNRICILVCILQRRVKDEIDGNIYRNCVHIGDDLLLYFCVCIARFFSFSFFFSSFFYNILLPVLLFRNCNAFYRFQMFSSTTLHKFKFIKLGIVLVCRGSSQIRLIFVLRVLVLADDDGKCKWNAGRWIFVFHIKCK